MRKFFGKLALAVSMLGLLGLASACGDAESNPCRWNVGKVELPESVVVEESETPCKLVLDFYAVDNAGQKAEFSREYELSAGQLEVVVGEIPNAEYSVWATVYPQGEEEPTQAFAAELESL